MGFVSRVVAHDREHDLAGGQITLALQGGDELAVWREDRFDPYQVVLGDSRRAQRQLKGVEFLAVLADALGQKYPFWKWSHRCALSCLVRAAILSVFQRRNRKESAPSRRATL